MQSTVALYWLCFFACLGRRPVSSWGYPLPRQELDPIASAKGPGAPIHHDSAWRAHAARSMVTAFNFDPAIDLANSISVRLLQFIGACGQALPSASTVDPRATRPTTINGAASCRVEILRLSRCNMSVTGPPFLRRSRNRVSVLCSLS